MGAGDRHRTPDKAGILSLVCADPASSVPRPGPLPLGVVPVVLITVWAACPNPLRSERGQARQRTALVPAEFTIVRLLHMALDG